MHSKTVFNPRAALAAAVVAALAGGYSVASADNDGSAISFNGTPYTQNFDALPNTPLNGYLQTPAPAEPTWTDNSTLPGWYANQTGSNTVPYTILVSDGTPKANSPPTLSGAIYSLGSADPSNPGTGLPDRSLGLVGTSSTGTGTLGVKLYNATGNTYNSVTLNYHGEEWFTGNDAATRVLQFATGIDNPSVAGGTFASSAALSFSSPENGTTKTVNGNTAPYQSTINGTVFTSTPWLPGHYLWLTWSLPALAKGPALGIDDLTFSATPSTTGRDLIWNPPGTTWTLNAGTTNWLTAPAPGGTAAAFTATDNANFTDTGVGAVTIDAAGVTAAAIKVSNTTGTYTFTGGSIGGGPLTKTGAGTLVLASSNAFAALNVNGGKVVVASDASMGAANGGLAFDNAATLQLTGDVASARAVTVNTSGGMIDTNGNAASFSGPVGFQGPFTKAGAGALTLSGSVSSLYGSTVSVAAGSLVFAQNGGTAAIIPPATANAFNGNIVIAGPTRLSFSAPGATTTGDPALSVALVSGTGQIQVEADGAAIIGATATGTVGGANTTIDLPIALNTKNLAGAFTTVIGESTAGNTLTLTSKAVISGSAGVTFSNAVTGGGAGTVIINSANTYTGPTTMNLSGLVTLGVDNALPANTALRFGDGANNGDIGTIDLNGHNITIASLASNIPTPVDPTSNTQLIKGITTGAGPATINVTGSATTTYAGVIGAGSQVNTGNDAIALDLTAAHTGQLTLSGFNTFTGPITVNGGTLVIETATKQKNGIVTTASALPASANVTNNAAFVVNAAASTAASIAGTGTTTVGPAADLTVATLAQGTLKNNGATTLTGTGTVGPIDGTGNLTVATGATLTAGHVRQGTLTVNGSARIAPAATAGAASGTSIVSSLTLAGATNAWTGSLDLTNNGLVIDYSADAASPLPTTANQVKSGYNGGVGATAWKGAGITSSVAAANAGKGAVGYGEAADVLNLQGSATGTFLGQTVDATSVLVRYTVFGDANLDGKVDFADFVLLSNHFGTSVAAGWDAGDFNYDGKVDFGDFVLLSNNFGTVAPSSAPGALAGYAAQAGQAAAVPEPGTAAIVTTLACAGLLARRRRRAKHQ